MISGTAAEPAPLPVEAAAALRPALSLLASIDLQNGQPAAIFFAPVASASRKRFSATFIVPGSSSFQNCAPPAPQQNELFLWRGISANAPPAFPSPVSTARGASA